MLRIIEGEPAAWRNCEKSTRGTAASIRQKILLLISKRNSDAWHLLGCSDSRHRWWISSSERPLIDRFRQPQKDRHEVICRTDASPNWPGFGALAPTSTGSLRRSLQISRSGTPPASLTQILRSIPSVLVQKTCNSNESKCWRVY